MKLLLRLLTSLPLLLFAINASTTFACQGPAPYDYDNLPEMDLWVRATVMDVDDRGFSAILKVHEYYKGEGPEWLAVVRYPVGLQTARRVRGYPTAPCLYAGYGTRLIHGREGYYGLSSNGDGAFTDLLYNAAHYFFIDGEMDGEYYVDDPDGYMDEIVLTEAEFVARLLEVGGRDGSVEPIQSEESRLPLMRYLLVTLEDGTRLHVNPDRSLTVLGDDDPIAISPDGAHTIYRESSDTLVFNYIWGKQYMAEAFQDQIKRPGRKAVYSPDSNMVAVWDDRLLTIYMYRNGATRGTQSWQSGFMAINQVSTADLTLSGSADLLIRWSADSGTIVWQDLSGIWRWNLFEDAQPTALPCDSDCATRRLVDVSRSGRYVSYRSTTQLRLFDSQTNETLEDAVASPNENFIISFEPDRDRLREWKRESGCHSPMNENCAAMLTFRDGSLISSFPYQMELMGSMFCEGDGSCWILGQPWHPSTNISDTGFARGREIDVAMHNVRQIAYDPYYDQPAVLRGDHQIEFEFYQSGYFGGWLELTDSQFARLDYLNLESIVDSPIASIEWGQPIFYDTFMLTAIEYLPRTVTIASGGSATPKDVSDA